MREDGRQEAREAGVRAPTAVRGSRAPSPPRPCLASRPACLLASALRTLPAGPHPGAGAGSPVLSPEPRTELLRGHCALCRLQCWGAEGREVLPG